MLSIPSTISKLVQKNLDLFSHPNLQLLSSIVIMTVRRCQGNYLSFYLVATKIQFPRCEPGTRSLLSSDEVTRAHPSRVVTPAPSQHQHRLLSVTRTTYFKQIGHPAQTIHCIVWQSIRSWNRLTLLAFPCDQLVAGRCWADVWGWYQAVIVTAV